MDDFERMSALAYSYLHARAYLIERGFRSELEWQERRSIEDVSESGFLREAAWVVLNAGMRESVVRQYFPRISQAFCDWKSAQTIVEKRSQCERAALACFNHKGKIEAIGEIATIIDVRGFDALLEEIRQSPCETLQSLPYIGPVTCHHLAKNLGLDAAKPDRHLARIASVVGFECPQKMCRALADVVGDRIAVVDLVLWRFATVEPEYTTFFGESLGGPAISGEALN